MIGGSQRLNLVQFKCLQSLASSGNLTFLSNPIYHLTMSATNEALSWRWMVIYPLIINVGQLQQHAASSTFDTKEMVSSTFSLSNLHVDLALTDT